MRLGFWPKFIKPLKKTFMLSFPPSQLFSLFPSLTSILLSFLCVRQSHPKQDRDILVCVCEREREREQDLCVFSFESENPLEIEEEKCSAVPMELNTPNKNLIPSANPPSQFEVYFL